MTTTTYLKLQKPPFDTIPWDDAINGNMDILDGFISQYMAVPNYVGVWANSMAYVAGQNTLDTTTAIIYTAAVTHTSAASPTTFGQDRTTNPSYWTASSGGFPIGSYATADDIERAHHNVGRNLIHNGLFRVAQRGPGPFTGNTHTLDRWIHSLSLDTISVTKTNFSDAQRAIIGDEEAAACYYNIFTGNAGAGAFNVLIQRIEDVRRLAGKTVTISFWALAATGTPKLGISMDQVFGTGGSPSAPVIGTGTSVTINTTPTRYSVTRAVPSMSGKTLGTAGDDLTTLCIWFSSGTSNAARAGSIGVQSATIGIWGVQLEVGSVATPLEKLDLQKDMSNCLRFYHSDPTPIGVGFNSWGVGAYFSVPVTFPTPMRRTPTVSVGAASSPVNVSSVTASGECPTRFMMNTFAGGAGGATVTIAGYTAEADL